MAQSLIRVPSISRLSFLHCLWCIFAVGHRGHSPSDVYYCYVSDILETTVNMCIMFNLSWRSLQVVWGGLFFHHISSLTALFRFLGSKRRRKAYKNHFYLGPFLFPERLFCDTILMIIRRTDI
jgi:hypothetical protein